MEPIQYQIRIWGLHGIEPKPPPPLLLRIERIQRDLRRRTHSLRSLRRRSPIRIQKSNPKVCICIVTIGFLSMKSLTWHSNLYYIVSFQEEWIEREGIQDSRYQYEWFQISIPWCVLLYSFICMSTVYFKSIHFLLTLPIPLPFQLFQYPSRFQCSCELRS